MSTPKKVLTDVLPWLIALSCLFGIYSGYLVIRDNYKAKQAAKQTT